MSHLADHFRNERVKRGLSLGQVARQVGYKNISKGANRIILFERAGTIKEELLVKLMEALEIDPTTALELLDRDQKEYLRGWNAWADEPVPMRLVVRLMAAVYCEKILPPEVTTQEHAEAWAAEFAKENHFRVCLAVNRRLSIWFDANGQITNRTTAKPGAGPNVPYMQIGGSKKKFLWKFKDKPGQP